MIYLYTDLESSSAYRRPAIVCDSWDLVTCCCNVIKLQFSLLSKPYHQFITKSLSTHKPIYHISVMRPMTASHSDIVEDWHFWRLAFTGD